MNGDTLERNYKEHLSGYRSWEQSGHAKDWVLIPQNLGARLCIDETQIGDEVYTILSRWEGHCRKGTVIAMVRGTAADDVLKILRKLPGEEREKVAEVTMDMSDSMRAIVEGAFPKAVITLDVFHMMKRCIDALEELRLKFKRQAQAETKRAESEFKKEQARLAEQRRKWRSAHKKKKGEKRGRKRKRKNAKFRPGILENGDTLVELLTRSKYALSQSCEKWSEKQRNRMKLLFKKYPKLNEAYNLVNGIRAIFRSSTLTRDTAKEKMKEWYDAVAKCTLREMKSARDALKNREEDVLNYFVSRSTNAMAESFNSKLKAFRAQLRGITDIPFFMFRLCKIFG